MSEIWYRGESTIVAPAKPGAYLHDFGDGVYFTDSVAVAKEYAELRVSEDGGEPRVLALNIERVQLGKLLDLNNDTRWLKYLKTPIVPKGLTPEQIIRTAGNENYSRFFSAFVAEHKINLKDFNAVLGPELVRGGNQLCVLHVGDKPSALSETLRRLFRPLPRVLPLREVQIPRVSSSDILMPKSPARRALGNQAAGAFFGQLLASAMQSLGEYGIQKQIQHDIDMRHAKYIGEMLSRGNGVLLIAAIEEAIIPDFNGNRARLFLTTYVQSGVNATNALETWRNQPKYLQGPSRGFNIVEQYAWIDPPR